MSPEEESFSKDAPPPRAFVGSKFKGRTNERQVKWASSRSWSWHRQKKMEKHSPWKTHLGGSKDNSFYPVIHETQQCVCKGCYSCAITAMNIEARSLRVHLRCSAGKHNVTEGPEDGSDPDTPGSRLPRNSQSSADFRPWASARKAGPPSGSSPHRCTHERCPTVLHKGSLTRTREIGDGEADDGCETHRPPSATMTCLIGAPVEAGEHMVSRVRTVCAYVSHGDIMITCLWIFAYFLGIDICDHGKNTCMITIACKEGTVTVGRETGKHLTLLKTQHYKTMTHDDTHLQDQRVNCRWTLIIMDRIQYQENGNVLLITFLQNFRV